MIRLRAKLSRGQVRLLHRSSATGTVILGLVLASTACKPWTVRPIQERSSQDSPGATFDARVYVESIWEPKVIPSAKATAVEIAEIDRMRSPGTSVTQARTSIIVRGTALVTDVDMKSRVGLAYLDVGTSASSRFALQVGPVLRGTALRDALAFVRFSDFVNQIDFAAVASELNARALQSAFNGVDPASLKGKTVSFWGATAVGPAAAAVLEIVPVSLRVEGSGP